MTRCTKKIKENAVNMLTNIISDCDQNVLPARLDPMSLRAFQASYDQLHELE